MRPATAKIVQRHLDYVRLLGRSEKTLHLRYGTLVRLARFLGDVDLLRVTPEQLEAFLAMPSKIASTRAVEGSHLKQFFHWATAKGLVQRDPTVLLPVPKKPRRLPRPLPIPDAATAIELAPPDVALILALACLCGLRAKEIAALRGSDVLWDYDPPLLHVRGKGDKDRRVPVPPQLARLLADAPRTGPLCRYKDPRRQHEHLRPVNVSQRANGFLYSLGMTSVHTLRHTAGTWFYRESGRDLRLTQEFLGHATPISTAIYTQVDPEEMSAVSRRLQLPFPSSSKEIER